jgi:hypothetical protein
MVVHVVSTRGLYSLVGFGFKLHDDHHEDRIPSLASAIDVVLAALNVLL